MYPDVGQHGIRLNARMCHPNAYASSRVDRKDFDIAATEVLSVLLNNGALRFLRTPK
jgi:hypothetical protein